MANAEKAPEASKPAEAAPVANTSSQSVKPTKSNNKVLIIVLLVVFFVFVLPGLLIAGGLWWFGRGDNAEKVAESLIENSTGDKVDINADDGTYSYESEDGSFELNSGEDLPEDFPDEVPVYPGQKITASYRSTTDEGSSWSVTAESKDSVSKVRDYFEDKMSTWENQGEYAANGTTTTLYKKGDLTVSVTVGPDSSDDAKTSIAYLVTHETN